MIASLIGRSWKKLALLVEIKTHRSRVQIPARRYFFLGYTFGLFIEWRSINNYRMHFYLGGTWSWIWTINPLYVIVFEKWRDSLPNTKLVLLSPAIRGKRKARHRGSWTHNLLVIRHALYHCATTTAVPYGTKGTEPITVKSLSS